MTYFKINTFEITPKQEVKLDIEPFHIKAVADVVTLTEGDTERTD